MRRFRRLAAIVVAIVSLSALTTAPGAGAEPGPLAPSYGIGTVGGTAGQLDIPTGVAVDAAGTVYVPDSNNNRVSVFSSQGSFLRAFGYDVVPGGSTGLETCTTSCKPGVSGPAAGQLSGPVGIAVDAGGDVYVGDTGNHRVSVFNSQGSFLRAFGADVIPGGGTGPEVCTTSCKIGTVGGAGGQLNQVSGVAIDASGNVYLADYLSFRVSVYTTQGAFLRAFGYDVVPGPPAQSEVCTTSCQSAAGGSAAGQFASMIGISADSAGNLYIGDYGNNRLSVFTSQGGFVRAFGFNVIPSNPGTGLEVCTVNCQQGAPGGGPGQFTGVSGAAIDGAGNVNAADQFNHRISVFTPQGAFLRAFGYDVTPGGGTGFEVCTTSCQVGSPGNGVGQLTTPAQPTSDCRGAIYVAEITGYRVQRFGEPGTALPPCQAAPPPPSNDFSFGKLKLNKKKGTAKLGVEVPGAGTVVLDGGKKAASQSEDAPAAGEVVLTIKAKGKSKKKLAKKGKLKLRLPVTFTPAGGEPNTEIENATLKRKG